MYEDETVFLWKICQTTLNPKYDKSQYKETQKTTVYAPSHGKMSGTVTWYFALHRIVKNTCCFLGRFLYGFGSDLWPTNTSQVIPKPLLKYQF